ncbi:MAG: hypothetical protein V7K83_00670 [Nostoc sp.]
MTQNQKYKTYVFFFFRMKPPCFFVSGEGVRSPRVLEAIASDMLLLKSWHNLPEPS